MCKFIVSILFSFLIAPQLAIAELAATSTSNAINESIQYHAEDKSFWCRKIDNRECNVNKSKCENRMSEKFDCFSRPTAWCFQARTFEGLDPNPDQMICVAHKADCEEWSEKRWNVTGKCLERHPDEYPISQTK